VTFTRHGTVIALDEEAARQSVDRLNQLNVERQHTVKVHFEELVDSI